MSITGYQLTKAFYNEAEQNEPLDVGATAFHQNLYTWICELRNRSKKEVVDLPVRYTMQMARIGSDKTLKKCIDDLEKWGIIEIVQRGSNQHLATKVKLAVAFLRRHCDSDKVDDHSAVADMRKQYDSDAKALRPTKTIKTNKTEKPSTSPSGVPTFDNFWEAYDRKENKKDSLKLWSKLSDQDKINIMAVVPAYVKATPDVTFRKLPSTFLNKESWKDEDIARRAATTHSTTPQYQKGEVYV